MNSFIKTIKTQRMKNLLILIISMLFAGVTYSQYNYGVDVSAQDARVEGKLNIDDGTNSIYIGRNAGVNNTITSNGANTLVGVESGFDLTTGFSNTFVGYRSGFNFTSGTSNCAIGELSGWNLQTGSNNTLLGVNAGYNVNSSWNNTIIGTSAGSASGLGYDNVFIGFSAGNNNTGTANIFIGSRAGQNESGSNKLYIENSNSSTPLIWGDFSTNDVRINGDLCYTGTIGTCSDKNFKKKITRIDNALPKILKINGIKHEWRHDEFPNMVWKKGTEYGVIAQEVNEQFPELVSKDDDGFLYVDYSKLTPILIEAIREQQDQIERMQSKISQIGILSAKIEALENSEKKSDKIASN